MKKILFTLGFLSLFGCTAEELFNYQELEYSPQSISLNHDVLGEMIIGETRRLIASFSPAESKDREIVWKCDDESVATVSPDGYVKATGLGKTIVHAISSSCPEISASCNIEVTQESGISVTDRITQSAVSSLQLFKDSKYEYDVFVRVFNSYDESIEITYSPSDGNLLNIEQTEVEECQGFVISTNSSEGAGQITLRSKSCPELYLELPFEIVTPKVAEVNLEYVDEDDDGVKELRTGSEISATLTIGRTDSVFVSFKTNIDGVEIPENSKVQVVSESDNVSLGEVVYNPDRSVLFTVSAREDAVPGGQAEIKVVSEDEGNHEAILNLTLDKPAVKGLVLDKEISRPVHAGDTVMLSVYTLPTDAYMQEVTWCSEDNSIASVNPDPENGHKCAVRIIPDFEFDPSDPEKTEKCVFAVSKENEDIKAGCRMLPYQYVPLQGVMVTDQWGNRIAGSTYIQPTGGTKEQSTYSECSVQYCSGTGTADSPFNNPAGDWGDATPAFPDAAKCGSIKVYLTATVYPFTYPEIADPDTKFCWVNSLGDRFAIPTEENQDGHIAGKSTKVPDKSCPTYTGLDGKYSFSDIQIGKTILFWTGNGRGDSDMTMVRLFEYDPLTAKDANAEKRLLFKFNVHIMEKDKENIKRSNWTMALPGTGGGRLFRMYRPASLGWMGSEDRLDITPWPWTGPDVKPAKGPEPYTDNYKKQGLPDVNITDGNPDKIN